jgi:multicomponent K+:H+ antiporter subunit G
VSPSPGIALWLDLLLSALVLFGAAFALIGSWGLARLSDFLRRVHGPTKASTLGVGCVLIASALWFTARGPQPSVHELLITLFVFLTAPVAAHLLVQAAIKLDPSLRPPPPTAATGSPISTTAADEPKRAGSDRSA